MVSAADALAFVKSKFNAAAKAVADAEAAEAQAAADTTAKYLADRAVRDAAHAVEWAAKIEAEVQQLVAMHHQQLYIVCNRDGVESVDTVQVQLRRDSRATISEEATIKFSERLTTNGWKFTQTTVPTDLHRVGQHILAETTIFTWTISL